MSDHKQSVISRVDEVSKELLSLSHKIHANPEVAWQEFESSAAVIKTLSDHGFDVVEQVSALPTAFRAEFGSGDLTVALCAEYDALPGLGHACGHNIIASSSVGAAIALASVARDLNIRVVVLGTPAEEGGGGKIEMARKGAFRNIDAAMMIHPADADLARMNAIAIQNLFVKFHGLAAHAAVSPHKGKNALDAAVLGYMNVAALRQHILPTERIHGIFTNSGEKPNIVPRETEMDWYVRSPTIETLQPLKERVAKCLEGGAMAAGCTVTFDWKKNTFADLVDNVPLLESYIRNAEQFGRQMTSEFLPGTGGGSTDMGNISYLVPSIHPMMQVAPSGVSLHSAAFADYTKGEEATRAIVEGAKIMAMTAIDMWLSKALQNDVKVAFGDGVVPEGVI